jgi:hypothetical protein
MQTLHTDGPATPEEYEAQNQKPADPKDLTGPPLVEHHIAMAEYHQKMTHVHLTKARELTGRKGS